MALTKTGKLEILAAQRGTLEHEQYAAETECEVKEAAVKEEALPQEELERARARLKAVESQIAVLDAKAKKVEAEPDDES